MITAGKVLISGADTRKIKLWKPVHINQDQDCPMEVIRELKPIYADMSSNALLRKCLHGKTQNRNESFNGMVWERVPKTRFSSLVHLEFGVYEAVANLNIERIYI